MTIKKTTKYDGKLKGLHFEDEMLLDSEGIEVDLLDFLLKAYGESSFDLSTTTKSEEEIELD